MKTVTRLIYLPALVLLVIMMIACAAPPVKDDGSTTTKVVPSWPAPPAAPRIQWVREICQPEQICRRSGFWQRFKEILAGRSRTGMVKPYGLYVDSRQRLFITTPVVYSLLWCFPSKITKNLNPLVIRIRHVNNILGIDGDSCRHPELAGL